MMEIGTAVAGLNGVNARADSARLAGAPAHHDTNQDIGGDDEDGGVGEAKERGTAAEGKLEDGGDDDQRHRRDTPRTDIHGTIVVNSQTPIPNLQTHCWNPKSDAMSSQLFGSWKLEVGS